MKLFLAIFIPLVIAACVGPFVPVVNLDHESRLQLRDRVVVHDNVTLKRGTYERLGQIEATSCMNLLWDPPASRRGHLDQLRYKASVLGGNGITNLICEKTEGANLAKNCWNSVTCYGVAIAVTSRKNDAAEAAEPTIHQGLVTATGFVVSHNGHILTNWHVVDGCRELTIRIGGRTHEARLLRQDPHNDLALLKVEPAPTQALAFRVGEPLRVGEDVISLGFPLSGLLAQEPHVTTGTITALAGIQDDTRYLQTSTPVQPGNSGGPLLDHSGNVVGIIVGKLDAIKMAVAIGDIPQNVNFALHGRLAQAFLDANGIDHLTSRSQHARTTPDIAAEAKGATVLMECHR